MTIALPDTEPIPVDDIEEDETQYLRQFLYSITEVADSHGERLVNSPYVEQNWLSFIGPTALLIARKMINNQSAPAQRRKDNVKVKDWALDVGVDEYEFLCACNRLVRWGFADWDEVKGEFELRRRWHDVPPMILTPLHRRALMDIVDEPLSKVEQFQ